MQNNVNERLKFLRMSKNLDVNQVAETTKIDIHSIYKYEKDVMPRPAKLKTLADFYGVSVMFLINGDTENSKTSNISDLDELKQENRTLRQQVSDLMAMIKELTNSVNMLSQKLGKLKGSQQKYTDVKMQPTAIKTKGKKAALMSGSVTQLRQTA